MNTHYIEASQPQMTQCVSGKGWHDLNTDSMILLILSDNILTLNVEVQDSFKLPKIWSRRTIFKMTHMQPMFIVKSFIKYKNERRLKSKCFKFVSMLYFFLFLPCSLFLYNQLFPSSINNLSWPKAALTKPFTNEDAKFWRAESTLVLGNVLPVNNTLILMKMSFKDED